MKRSTKKRVSVFDPALQNGRLRRRQLDNADMMIQDEVLLECYDTVSYMMSLTEAEAFNIPVDWRAWNLPTYPLIIKNPMDLGTVKEMLLDSTIDSHDKFAEYVRLVFSNAMTFNLAESPIWVSAKNLLDEFERHYEELQARHKIGKFMVLDASSLAVQPPVSYTPTPLSSSGSKQRQKVRPQSPKSPRYPSQATTPVYTPTYDDNANDPEVLQMEEQIRSLQDSIKRINDLIAEEKAKQERAAEEARNRPPKRLRLTPPIKPVAFEERQDLVYKIPHLDQADLPELVEIVRASAAQKGDSDEFEIDIENMDDRTFRKVQDFVFQRIAMRQQQMELSSTTPSAQDAMAVDSIPTEEQQQQHHTEHQSAGAVVETPVHPSSEAQESAMEVDTAAPPASEDTTHAAALTVDTTVESSAPSEPAPASDTEQANAESNPLQTSSTETTQLSEVTAHEQSSSAPQQPTTAESEPQLPPAVQQDDMQVDVPASSDAISHPVEQAASTNASEAVATSSETIPSSSIPDVPATPEEDFDEVAAPTSASSAPQPAEVAAAAALDAMDVS